LYLQQCGNLNERDCSAHPEPHPSLRSGPAWRLSKSVPDEFVEPAIGFTLYTTPDHPGSTTRTPLRMGETISGGHRCPAKKRKDNCRPGYRQADRAIQPASARGAEGAASATRSPDVAMR
jgi:hypothetical protein